MDDINSKNNLWIMIIMVFICILFSSSMTIVTVMITSNLRTDVDNKMFNMDNKIQTVELNQTAKSSNKDLAELLKMFNDFRPEFAEFKEKVKLNEDETVKTSARMDKFISTMGGKSK